jgi:hypothetical protein
MITAPRVPNDCWSRFWRRSRPWLADAAHDIPDFRDLIAVTARERGIDPGLVEKDYWIMHALWGLQQLGLTFELKGGTSLSKGYGLIHRFSEDIDILIHPEDALPVGRNQDKPAQVAARQAFYDALAAKIVIPGFQPAERDTDFDDVRYFRSAGIRLPYVELNALPAGIKTGILLETGFDQVAPNQPRLISSWAYEQAVASGLENLTDSRALGVPCYEPGYTLVEKLQTISTKYRAQQASGQMPANFMRHYYDVFCLLDDPDVQAFIGTPAYLAHKEQRFRTGDDSDIARNPAFALDDAGTRAAYARAYTGTRALYYRDQPPLEAILDRIGRDAGRL